MTYGEAKSIASKRLKFGDASHIEALNMLEMAAKYEGIRDPEFFPKVEDGWSADELKERLMDAQYGGDWFG